MWAHSVNGAGSRHRLVDHLEGTAAVAAAFASAFGGAEAGRFLGLAHDVGKASCAWQEKLLRAEATHARVGFDHKSLGAVLAQRRGNRLLALPLHGHHGGLTDLGHIDTQIASATAQELQARADAEAALRPLLPEPFDGPPVPLPDGFGSGLEREMLVRFLYSALVDADGLDTAAHTFGGSARVAPPTDMEMLWDRFDRRRRRMLGARLPSEVDRWRAEVYDACLAAASGPSGFYRLPAPTGSGKTIAAAAFGLRHAVKHGKSRVIVAVPFTTITGQNAGVYRTLLDPSGPGGGDPVVLEHHSNVDLDTLGLGQRWARLAAENWDAPFIVTTTVQLFESLFGRKPSVMRKVHRLANAVIVLDEIQALPPPLLVPIVDGLRVLTERFGTTVLLASATQPDLTPIRPYQSIRPIEVIADPKRLYRALRRVRYEWWTDPAPTLEQVADRVARPAEEPAGRDQSLTVVNTVADARRMHGLVVDRVSAETRVWHLSTAMCPAHRRQVLADLKESLTRGLPVRLVSTQLIEAGVDLDFPTVFRAMAPADSLQQAAGRANREGALGPEGGLCVIFDASDAGQPSTYKLPVRLTRERMGPGRADPDDLDALNGFYRSYFRQPLVTGTASRGAAVQQSRSRLDFRSVTDGPPRDQGTDGQRDRSQAFRMIDEDTVPVAVPYKEDVELVRRLVDDLRTSPAPDASLFRRIQPYLVMIQRRTWKRPEVHALCRPIVGDLLEWIGDYDEDTGIVLTPSPEAFIA